MMVTDIQLLDAAIYFLYPATLKIYPPFKNLRLSVRPSVCPSVSASFQLSARCIFEQIFFKLGMRIDIGKECPGIADG